MKGNPYLGIYIDDTEPKDCIIRKEDEPLLRQGLAFRAYLADGTPLYMGEATIEALETRLKASRPVNSITYQTDKIYDRR
jgi:hypothetical protein